jgi:acetyl esterase/lipase
VVKDIPYPGEARGDRLRSFDLYRPAKPDAKPPLLIFVHGGFWALSDDTTKATGLCRSRVQSSTGC